MPPFHDSASQRSPVLHHSGEKRETARNKHNTGNHIAFFRYVGSLRFATDEETSQGKEKGRKK